MDRIIKITCDGTDYVDYRSLMPFQGDLKTLSEENLDKLKQSIIKYGFTVPAFVWEDQGKKYILDAHQRQKALQSLFEDGYTIPDIPIIYIQAADRKEAAAKLLHISSQYGEFTQQGFADFVLDADLNIDDLNIRLTNEEMNLSLQDNIVDYEEFDNEMDYLSDIEDIEIRILIPSMYQEKVLEFLSNGERKEAAGLGRGVMKRCGLV